MNSYVICGAVSGAIAGLIGFILGYKQGMDVAADLSAHAYYAGAKAGKQEAVRLLKGPLNNLYGKFIGPQTKPCGCLIDARDESHLCEQHKSKPFYPPL